MAAIIELINDNLEAKKLHEFRVFLDMLWYCCGK